MDIAHYEASEIILSPVYYCLNTDGESESKSERKHYWPRTYDTLSVHNNLSYEQTNMQKTGGVVPVALPLPLSNVRQNAVVQRCVLQLCRRSLLLKSYIFIS